MKKISITIALFIAAIITGYAQEAKDDFKPSGKGTGTVFFNYHNDFTKDVTQKSGFEIERAYLGYVYNFSKTISAKVVYDVGYDATVKTYTGYVKNAMLDWKIDPAVKLSMGLIGAKQFDTQEKFWGHRYIMKTHADQYGLGTSADLGVNFEIKASEKVMFNAFMLNGEGYKALQDANGNHRIGANAIVNPVKGLTLKIHYDILPTTVADNDVTISNLSAFAGFEFNEKTKLGIEYNLLNNGEGYKKPFEDKTLGGISAYASHQINSKFEIFTRYDTLLSNELAGATDNWNYAKDGSLLILGAQYSPLKGVYTSLNYQTWMYDNSDIDNRNGIYLNLGVTF